MNIVQDRPFAKLRGFLNTDREPAPRRERSGSVCDLCSVPLPAEHRHLLEMASRDVACACNPCALRFQNVVQGRYKLIPRDVRSLTNFQMSDAQWAALAVPIDLVFIYFDSVAEKRTALYPSPAGVTESLLTLTAWDDLQAENEMLTAMEADVEALLVNRLGDEPRYYLAPIDDCYELAGIIRMHWRGLSGGEEVWNQVDLFFNRMERGLRHA